MSDYLTTEEVCGTLSRAGVDAATVGKVFAARLQPQNLDDKDKKFVMGVPAPNGEVFLIVYKFGLGKLLVKRHPLDEDGPDWRPRWIGVMGPFDKESAQEHAAALTNAS